MTVRNVRLCISVFLLLHLGSLPALAQSSKQQPLQRIALGSCARQNKPQPIWEAIVTSQPDLFVFMGDNIYADTEDMDEMRAKYALLASKPGFQKLRATCPILAVWDDHDYGVDDGGADYAMKAESQQVFNEFFNVPRDAPRRSRPGIYDATTLGPPGKRVQLIVLDTRYFKGPWKRLSHEQRQRQPGLYQPNTDTAVTLLGQTQWEWLARQLEQPATLRIVVSSIQVVADQHGWETWGNLPHERARLFRMIAASGASGVLFVSGDRHMAELSRAPTAETDVTYPLYDLTSSSLNQRRGEGLDEPNRNRLGKPYGEPNFGLITIDWHEADPAIVLTIHNVEGTHVLRHRLRLSELAAAERDADDRSSDRAVHRP